MVLTSSKGVLPVRCLGIEIFKRYLGLERSGSRLDVFEGGAIYDSNPVGCDKALQLPARECQLPMATRPGSPGGIASLIRCKVVVSWSLAYSSVTPWGASPMYSRARRVESWTQNRARRVRPLNRKHATLTTIEGLGLLRVSRKCSRRCYELCPATPVRLEVIEQAPHSENQWSPGCLSRDATRPACGPLARTDACACCRFNGSSRQPGNRQPCVVSDFVERT